MITFAQSRANLRHQGLLIPDFDLLIAAMAIAHNLILLSRNTRHYQRLSALSLYQSP